MFIALRLLLDLFRQFVVFSFVPTRLGDQFLDIASDLQHLLVYETCVLLLLFGFGNHPPHLFNFQDVVALQFVNHPHYNFAFHCIFVLLLKQQGLVVLLDVFESFAEKRNGGSASRGSLSLADMYAGVILPIGCRYLCAIVLFGEVVEGRLHYDLRVGVVLDRLVDFAEGFQLLGALLGVVQLRSDRLVLGARLTFRKIFICIGIDALFHDINIRAKLSVK